MISTLYVSFMGQFQYNDRPTGQEMLWRNVHSECCGRTGFHATWPLPWDYNVAGLAQRTLRMCETDPPCKIIVSGYSRGGDTAVKFCRALGRRVFGLILCDAVRHNWFAWMLPKQTIDASGIAQRLVSFRQKENVPAGNTVLYDPATLATTTWLTVPHQQMDEAPEYHTAVINMLRRAVNH